jgi:hypothetical protein
LDFLGGSVFIACQKPVPAAPFRGDVLAPRRAGSTILAIAGIHQRNRPQSGELRTVYVAIRVIAVTR